ncbi:GAF domain-containing protein [Ramlibacter sp. USB13]|uniref:histidine kinase n=1 Tax=Ramlibacter cellulosilyticus TaxID=2764187 RepID=A0A923MM53_9BURK|nr:ATP-binding protein [Ramlibacter cellulosilyticus]MBC5782162.1 GAF domain-containing protein [Ramlibacter cellulosilyticus]
MSASQVPPTVNLDNCDREPIHIPGAVQSHGALLAFAPDGTLRWASAGAAGLLGVALPALGERLGSGHFGGDAQVPLAIAGGMEPIEEGMPPLQHEATLAGRAFDVSVHRSGGLAVAEFEPRRSGAEQPGAFAIRAHRGLDRLRRGRSVQELLELAVHEIRALTGFDRVMAYRFRHDASGDVVAEARDEALEPFLNRRYPASDIPAQARRLYVTNTLRLIADVRSAPVPLEGSGPPLDLSQGVLRAVSPVHIEYLTNLGVGASMSVSIVVGGRLWGMLACHHMTARHVPYGVRMACDVLAHVLAAGVQSQLSAEHASRVADAASLRGHLVEALLVGDDPVLSLRTYAEELRDAFEAQAIAIAEGGRLSLHGDLPQQGVQSLLEWLRQPERSLDSGLFAANAHAELPPGIAADLGSWCGVLALRFDEVADAWVVILRREQIETISWGGRPEKQYVNGPLGPRLTPRGSFEVWKETVRGTAVPWTATEREIARQLRDELGRAASVRHAELGRARNQLLAVLGHDLRNPLQTISMTSHLLERGVDAAKMGQRIQSATSRMQRLVGQVLDMSRLQAGLGLGFAFQPVDLRVLVDNLVDEAVMAYPGSTVERSLPPTLPADVDPDRFAQLLGNLLSNARHHGEAGKRVAVHLAQQGGEVLLSVRNVAAPIPEEAVAQLFTPYKRQSVGNARNKGGLGLGLYIAHEIARGHGGSLEYAYEAPDVVFTVRFPAKQG